MKTPHVRQPKYPLSSHPTSKQVITRGVPDMREPSMNSLNMKEKTMKEYSHPFFIQRTQQETVLDRTSKHGTIFDTIQMQNDPEKMIESGIQPEYREPGSLMYPKKHGRVHRVPSHILNIGTLDKAADSVGKDLQEGAKEVSISKATIKRDIQGTKDISHSGGLKDFVTPQNVKNLKMSREVELEEKQKRGIITMKEFDELQSNQLKRQQSIESGKRFKEGLQELAGPTGIKSLEPSDADLKHMKERGLKPEELYVSEKSPHFKKEYIPVEVRAEPKPLTKQQIKLLKASYTSSRKPRTSEERIALEQAKELSRAKREANRERRHQELLALKTKKLSTKESKQQELQEAEAIVSDIKSFEKGTKKLNVKEEQEEKQLRRQTSKEIKDDYMKSKIFQLSRDPKYMMLKNRTEREEYIKIRYGSHDTSSGSLNLNGAEVTRMARLSVSKPYVNTQFKQPTKSELEALHRIDKTTSTSYTKPIKNQPVKEEPKQSESKIIETSSKDERRE